MKVKLFTALFSILFLLGGCRTPKDVAYLQGMDDLSPEQIKAMSQEYVTRIRPSDRLKISVTSWNPNAVAPFNAITKPTQLHPESTVSEQSKELITYLVDEEGDINFPVLGNVKVAGLTLREIEVMLQNRISEYADDAIVNAEITNFKVVMMGEFLKPGPINVTSYKISILDAIGMAGDLSINAQRTNLMVIRENGNGELEYGRLDITKPDVFASPFYYLQQNDVVYAEPNNARKKNSRYSQAAQYNITVWSTIISTASVISSMIIALSRDSSKK